MKIHSKILTITFAWGVFSLTAGAQEEQLEAALKMNEDRKGGLNELAEKVQNFGFLKFARKLTDKLENRERKVDPFGMPMDPEDVARNLLPEAMAVSEEQGPRTTLEEAIAKFQVSGVNPNRGEVMVGPRLLKEGDLVQIKHADVSFRLRIDSVSADEVRLRDVETGELALVSLNIVRGLPAGMERKGSTGKKAEKMAATPNGSTIIPMDREYLTLD